MAAAVSVTLALLLLAVPAQAAQRFASPTGTDTACTQANPCSIVIAAQAAVGDEVILEPGDYTTSVELAVPAQGSMHGRAGAPRPRIFTTADRGMDVRPGGTLSDIEIHHTSTSIAGALHVRGTADRVYVRSTSDACGIGADGALIRNSVCYSTGADAYGFVFAVGSSAPTSWTGTLRNVTIFSQFGWGMLVDAGDNTELVVRATNVNVFGVADDIQTREFGTQGIISATVILDYSIYQFVDTSQGGLVTPPGSPTNKNVQANFYVDFPNNDFRLDPDSEAIDAGITSPANGPADLDGRARAQGASTDIGAHEVPVAGGGSGASSGGAVTADKTKPVTSQLDVRPDAFAALSGRGSSLISAKRKKAKKGATVNYRLSEAATVTFTVERRARGRKRGRRCIAGRKKGKRCNTYKKVKGSFTHSGRPGTNTLRFSGRLARKPLRPGSYRLVGVARDAAGNKGTAVRTGFRIVRG
jgi:hypothetical protein